MFIINPSRFTSASTGLVARWLMNEGTGTTAVDSVGARNLTLTNGPTWGVGSVILDGVDDYLIKTSTNFGLNGATEMSFCFYLKTTTTAARVFFKGGSVNGAWLSYYMRITGTGNFFVEMDNLALGQYPTWTLNGTSLCDGSWHHFAFTYKRNAINVSDGVIYIDKSPVAASSFDGSSYTSGFLIEEQTDNFTLGAKPTDFSGPFLAGELKDVRIYNKQLTAGEVTALP